MAREQLVLPDNVVGPSDLARIARELEQFDEEVREASIRAKSSGNPVDKSAVQPGNQLRNIAEVNDVDLSAVGQRVDFQAQLKSVLKVAPTVTMSFAVDPSSAFMVKITAWFRKSIHPHVLVRTGLQPNIAAGFTLRTPGKVYDFSLRGKFTEQRPELIKRLRAPAKTAKVEATA